MRETCYRETMISYPLISVNDKGAGVYAILDRESDCLYIGSTIKLRQRYLQHMSDLRMGRHSNTHLQAVWQKRGPENLSFHVLEKLSGEDENLLLEAENRWLDTFKDRLMNFQVPAVKNGVSREAIRQAWQRPENRQNWLRGLKAAWADPELKAKRLAEVIPSFKTPSARLNRSLAKRGTNSKLTKDHAAEIRKLCDEAQTDKRLPAGFVAQLSLRFGVSRTNIYHIFRRSTWQHIDETDQMTLERLDKTS